MRRLRTAAQVSSGLVLVGAAGYVFVALVGRGFPSPRYTAQASALAALYLLINIIGPGLFTAVEQETSRSVSACLARGLSPRPAALRAATLAAGLFGVLCVVLAALWLPVLSRVLDGRLSLLLALAVAGAGAAVAYWLRGLLAGQQRFGAYAATLHVEGGLRLLGTLALVLFAGHTTAGYGLVFAAGAGAAGLAVLPWARLPAGRDAPGQVSGMLGSLALLVAATLLSQVVANLAPVVVAYRLPDDLARASTFTATFVLARVPLFLFAPVQALLLPSLTRAATEGRRHDLTARVRLVLLAVLAIGVPGAVAAALVGPWAVQTLFASAQRPATGTLALLGAATLVLMCVQVLQPALVALRAQRVVTVAWVSGTAAFLVCLVAPVDPLAAALAAQLVGPGTVVAVMGLALLQRLRRQEADDLGRATPLAAG